MEHMDSSILLATPSGTPIFRISAQNELSGITVRNQSFHQRDERTCRHAFIQGSFQKSATLSSEKDIAVEVLVHEDTEAKKLMEGNGAGDCPELNGTINFSFSYRAHCKA